MMKKFFDFVDIFKTTFRTYFLLHFQFMYKQTNKEKRKMSTFKMRDILVSRKKYFAFTNTL